MSHPSVWVTTVPACGSHTPARKFVFVATFPDPDTTRTLPFRISATWTGLIGIVVASVVHWPVMPFCDWARGVRVERQAAPIARKARVFRDGRLLTSAGM